VVRYKHPKQLSQAEIERFLADAERLHKTILRPLISPQCEHYRALQALHEALLKTVKDITGNDAPFIRWHGTGPVRKGTA
jgi:integrase